MAKKVTAKKTGPGKPAGATKLTLRAPEKQLAACVRRGEQCIFDPKAPEKTRTLRAEVIERLVRGRPLSGEKAVRDLPPKGLHIDGAIISGALDLSCCDCPARLGFFRCEFDSPINLIDARLRGLFLSGSSLNGLQADRLAVEGPLVMRDIRSKGEVRLSSAAIAGTLSLSGATLENTDLHGASALFLDRARIGGSAFLDQGFSAKGEVRLHAAAITGILSLSGATLENTDEHGAAAGDALNLQNLTVSGVCAFDRLAQPPIGHVDLRGMTASDLADDGSLWPNEGQGDLSLNGFIYNHFVACKTDWRFRKDWLLRQAPRFLGEEFAPQPWVQCAKVLREMGHEHDARLLQFEMHEALRRALRINVRKAHTIRFWKNSWGWLWSQILRWTAGHGYRPGRFFGWIVGIIFIGVVIFSSAQSADRMTPAKGRFYLNEVRMQEYECNGVLPAGYPKFSPIIYSVDVFLPIVSLLSGRSLAACEFALE